MRQFKTHLPMFVSIGVFFFAGNSPMWRQMNEPRSVENEIKFIPVKEFK